MKRKTLSLMLIISIMLSIMTTATIAPISSASSISAQDFVNSIGPGWNLGNTLDAVSDGGTGFPWLGNGTYAGTSVADMETAWLGAGNGTTKSFIEAVHASGFRAIRIPVSWNKVADPNNNYTIRSDWFDRVKEVVNWAYELDMHIILNTHHENSFIGLTDAQITQSEQRLARIWEQIAHEFRTYSDMLIFAGLNEPRGQANEWGGGVIETRNNLNRLNQVFVNTVRSSTGNNPTRFLIVPTHAASATDEAFNGFTIPNDPANDKMILAVHTYSPFAWAHNGVGQYTGAAGLRSDLNRVREYSEKLGVPVILSEWGSINNGTAENLQQRVDHAYDYVSYARSLAMATFWWDNSSVLPNANGEYHHTFGLFNRITNAVYFPEIVDSIMKAFDDTPPGSGLNTSTPDGGLSVRLMGMGGDGWPHFTGDDIVVMNNNTQYTVTLQTGGTQNMATLNIENVGEIHERFHPATIEINSVIINGSVIGHTHNPASDLAYVNNDGVRVVDTVFWNQWWEGGQILTTGVVRNDGGHFSLSDGSMINTVSVTFTISGALPPPDPPTPPTDIPTDIKIPFHKGDIDNDGRTTITDVLEVLKFLAGIQSSILIKGFTRTIDGVTYVVEGGPGSRPWVAAQILPASQATPETRPTIGDVLEMLKFLAKIPTGGIPQPGSFEPVPM